jgi:outer membrane protein TolC
VAAGPGCSSPLYDQPDRDIRRAIREASARELAQARSHPQNRVTRREDSLASLHLDPEVVRELNSKSGPDSYINERRALELLAGPPPIDPATGEPPPPPPVPTPDLGPSLLGPRQQVMLVSLEHAVKTAVNNNLNAAFARLAPAIAQNQVAAAEAAFDFVLFNNTTWSNTDQPRVNSSINGSTVGVSSSDQNTFDTAFGVRRPLISGGTVTVQHQFVYTDDTTPNLFLSPDPSRTTNIVLQLDQPLLRNFGSDFTLSQVRLARNQERDSIQELKGTLDKTATDAEQQYWQLVAARDNLLIRQRLLTIGEQVFEKLRSRPDMRPSNLANANSAVQTRKSDVMRAQRALRSASDALKLTIHDKDNPIGRDVLLLPVDTAVDQPIEFSLMDSLNTAMANRPEIQRAIVSVDNTTIRRAAADNQRLPQLNLRALMRFNGLAGSTGDSYDQLTSGRFVDYQVQGQFEMPIGNRAAEANYRVRRIEEMQAVTAYQNTLEQVFKDVIDNLRDIDTDYMLIEQTRVARIAAAEELRQLESDEEHTAGLTPEFLDLKLRQQQSRAEAEQSEVQALIDFNISLAKLHQATGTALERNRILFDVPHIRPESRESDLFPDYSSVKEPR